MPNVNLSTLSGPELRRLLDSARQRGEAALSYRILQEMEARRESGERKGLFPFRRSGELQTVSVNLGDPMARDDEDDVPPMPFWRAPSQVAEASPEPEPAPDAPPPRLRRVKTQREAPPPEPEAEPQPEPEPLLSFRYPEPEPEPEPPAKDWDLRFNPASPEGPPAPPPRGLRRGLAAGFAVGIAAGVSLGWWVWGAAREAPAPPATPAPAARIQTAALEHPPAPAAPLVAEPAPAPEAPPEPAVASSPDLQEAAPTPPDVPQIAPAAEAAPAEAAPTPPARQQTEAVRSAEALPANACAAEPTPADRTICGDPELRSLQHQLRQAYNEALEAHEDRALLRQRQLAWANARDTVTDSERLAQLYEQRIHKLNAATAEARRQH